MSPFCSAAFRRSAGLSFREATFFRLCNARHRILCTIRLAQSPRGSACIAPPIVGKRARTCAVTRPLFGCKERRRGRCSDRSSGYLARVYTELISEFRGFAFAPAIVRARARWIWRLARLQPRWRPSLRHRPLPWNWAVSVCIPAERIGLDWRVPSASGGRRQLQSRAERHEETSERAAAGWYEKHGS